MKRMFLVAALLVTGLVVSAQNEICEYLVQELVSDMNGLIISESDLSDGSVAVNISLPEHFDKDLVFLKVQVPVRRYDDMFFTQAWTVMKEIPEAVSCKLVIGDQPFMIVYFEKFNRLVMFYNKDANEKASGLYE